MSFVVRAAGGLVLLAAIGCSRGSLPPKADPDQARIALRAALDAWQQGETSDSLAARQPPFYFNDPKCVSDVKLVRYTLDEGHEYHGQTVRLTAMLYLNLKDGPKEKKAKYLIDTSPVVVIVAE
jgi:hypothetical protein